MGLVLFYLSLLSELSYLTISNFFLFFMFLEILVLEWLKKSSLTVSELSLRVALQDSWRPLRFPLPPFTLVSVSYFAHLQFLRVFYGHWKWNLMSEHDNSIRKTRMLEQTIAWLVNLVLDSIRPFLSLKRSSNVFPWQNNCSLWCKFLFC